ncbi:MAG TPA: ABC transporter substrate-binding protein [Candidatus Acidoferrales bacterium]|jgi:NitT/TauT family transport system substrate-binding protein|nr:ABC transporter substrate-binding protein [Candidatus Acidoferrales bacterium]
MHPSRARFLATASGAFALGVPFAATAQSTGTLRVASTASDSYGEALYGVDQGIFKAHGLNVDLQILSSGAAIVAAVAAGAVDIGITNALPLVAAVQHGVPFLYLCPGGLINQDEIGLCVSADSPIRTGKDLEGKTAATSSLNDINVIAIRAWTDQQGGDSSKVRIVEMPFAQMAIAVRRGTIDAAPIAEPALSVAKKDGGLRILLPPIYSVYGNNFMVGGWFATSDWISKNRETARRFVAAIYDTARWANSHPDESAAILAKYAKLDPAVVKNMSRAPYATRFTPNMIQSVLDLAYKYKAVDRQYKAAALMAKL